MPVDLKFATQFNISPMCSIKQDSWSPNVAVMTFVFNLHKLKKSYIYRAFEILTLSTPKFRREED